MRLRTKLHRRESDEGLCISHSGSCACGDGRCPGAGKIQLVDRHRRHRRRVLPAGRRDGEHPVQVRARPASHGRGDRRLGGQPQAHRDREALHRVFHGGRRPGRVPRRGQVQGHQGAATHSHGFVPQSHARGHDRWHWHHEDGGPEGKARLDRLTGQRDRGDGVPRHRGRGPRQGPRHEARAARRRRVGERAQGQKDRRLLLGGRVADRGRDRPRQHSRHQDQDDRPRRHRRRDEQEIRPALHRGRHPEGDLQGHGRGQSSGHGVEHPRFAREPEQPDRLQHRQDHLRQARRHDRRAQGGGEFQAGEPEGHRLTDSFPSRRGQVFCGARREDSLSGARSASAGPTPRDRTEAAFYLAVAISPGSGSVSAGPERGSWQHDGGLMLLKALSITGCFIVLAGCAAAPRAPLPAHLLWQDQAFDYDAGSVSVGKRDLFQLDPDLLSKLQDPSIQNSSTQYRAHHLVSLLFGRETKDFPYSGGHSTIAAETWRRKSGDCLSLTVLAYSLANALHMSVQMQEVRVPVVFDRRGNVESVNRHVNVLIRGVGQLYLKDGSMRSGDVIIDFEPQIASRREGLALSDDGILARFYNNVAVEYLAQGDLTLAYAHFKAAILADAGYSPTYGNLAQLYKRRGLLQSAERLLLYAIAFNDDADIA